MPLSGGPSLIFASAPASWQGEHHFLKAASLCAIALPAEATTSNEASIQVFILDLLYILPTPPFSRARSCWDRRGTVVHNCSNDVWRGPCQRPPLEFPASRPDSIERARLRI